MTTKQKYKNEELGPIVTDPTPQVLDDQTPIDLIEKNNSNKDDLQGFSERLPAGVERTIRVLKDKVGKKNPISIEDNKSTKTYDDIKVEGECQVVHNISGKSCRITGSVSIKTSASILVKRKK